MLNISSDPIILLEHVPFSDVKRVSARPQDQFSSASNVKALQMTTIYHLGVVLTILIGLKE